jgi:hypothetical protein
VDSFSIPAVVENDVEAAHGGDQELDVPEVRMSSARRTSRNVVEIVDARNRERDLYVTLDRGQVASGVNNPWKFDRIRKG